LYREIFLLHLVRKYAFQISYFTFSSHSENADSLFGVIRRLKKRKALDMIPMKMGKYDVDDILFNATLHNFFSQVSDARSCIKNCDPVHFFTKYSETGSVAPVFLKLSAANGQ
jgi:hypothetical protein